jgi:hypothetical protein
MGSFRLVPTFYMTSVFPDRFDASLHHGGNQYPGFSALDKFDEPAIFF